MIYWRLPTGVVLTSVEDRAVVKIASERDSNGSQKQSVVIRRRVPYGAEALAETPSGPWRPMTEFPGFSNGK